jgi:hypothetical protein
LEGYFSHFGLRDILVILRAVVIFVILLEVIFSA